ncbi:MAG: CTP synthase [Alphaproteobacteria bacterium]
MTRYIFVTGGGVSSLGKGLAAASLAALLQSRGYKVRLRKLDPYLNIDPGTMSPYQHGEVYVTEDGAETDLDLGHYERFTNVSAKASDSITTGKVYAAILQKERRGDYLGATVQVIPHVIDEIKEFVLNDSSAEDFVIAEIGGTVGDMESLPYLETIRQLRNDLGAAKTLFIHLTLLPYVAAAGELKTKPTQHSVKELLSVGIQPNILLCRCERPMPVEARQKIALFCNLKPENVIEAIDVDTIYQVPLNMHAEKLDTLVCNYFGLETTTALDLTTWQHIVSAFRHPKQTVTIAIVGKYTRISDAYRSLVEALNHAGWLTQTKVNIQWVDAEGYTDPNVLSQVQGIIVPGGFGKRGTDGMIAAIQWAREQKIPFLGICFGMQLAVIETSRNVLGLSQASSTEFGSTDEPVVALMTEWLAGDSVERRKSSDDLGGTMRLGTYHCHLKTGSLISSIYGKQDINERHRHRWEVNMTYKDRLETAGMIISGTSLDGALPEIVERHDHPWFVGVQFHPEFKSRPQEPHPLFVSFIKASIAQERA